MFTNLLAATASVALIGASAVAPPSFRSSEAMPVVQTAAADGEGAGGSNLCRVDVVRTGQAGTVTSTRSVMRDHSCVCTLVTGPEGNNGNAEDVVTAMLRDRRCPDSPMVAGPVSAAAEVGHNGFIIPVLIGVVGAAALAATLGNNNNNVSRG